jgi:hypothetical protein
MPKHGMTIYSPHQSTLLPDTGIPHGAGHACPHSVARPHGCTMTAEDLSLPAGRPMLSLASCGYKN